MLKIHNLKWEFNEFKYYNDIIRILQDKMKLYSIKCNIDLVKETTGNVLVFKDVEPNKTFCSSVDNKVFLKEGDARIKKNGRNYLLSQRVTKEQYDKFFENIQGTLNELGLLADVFLINEKINMNLKLREGKEVFNNLPQQKSYPVKG